MLTPEELVEEIKQLRDESGRTDSNVLLALIEREKEAALHEAFVRLTWSWGKACSTNAVWDLNDLKAAMFPKA